ncbi:HK97 family phage prohead protease [Aurantimonas sp. E1-2-R+4]|uniref:HK97 family phage prohead protease n=1 Tax=Aurantimonas sp. E1-2-R+4 TaxID=3113714 RepID=UPI002F957F44
MTKRDLGATVELDTKAIGEDGTFTGYASIFGNRDDHRDIVMPGAYKASLVARPASRVKMLWHHDPTTPIGVWDSIEEDGRGLKVKGRLLLDLEKGREVHALMKAGIIDSLSVGYRAVRHRMDRTKGARILEAVDLWEISAVTFPSNAEATISGVKHHQPTDFSNLVAAINSARTSLSKGIK